MSDAACPALAELLAEQPSAAITEHAASCLRCDALLRSAEERADVTVEETTSGRPGAVAVEPGSVVLIAAEATDELLPAVVLAVAEEALTIAPISAEAELATEWDLLLPEGALGYAAAAQVWNL